MVHILELDAQNATWAWKQRDLDSISNVLDELALPLWSSSSDSDPMREGGGGTRHSWIPTLTYPSEVHAELLKRRLIKDPYRGFEEHNAQWIGDVEWLYRCTFAFDAKDAKRHTVLEFQGLDTLCDAYLDGKHILSADNQFRTWVVPLELPPSGETGPKGYVLLLHFKSARLLALELEKQYGAVRAGSTNLGHPSRVYVRKAQYDWRWDWGPELMTCGPYRPVVLKSYSVRIEEFYPRACLRHPTKSDVNDPDELQTYLNPQITVSGDLAYDTVRCISVQLIEKSTGKVIAQTARRGLTMQDFETHNGRAELGEMWEPGKHPKEVKWWWPIGYGEQPLYDVKVQISDENDTVLDEATKTVGFRTIKLIEEPLAEPDQYGTGTSFLFEVNGVRMFIGGSNWIPADNFLTTITHDRYRAWLQLLRDGNQNMVRIWGGGIYEPDIFYDICDELGILVWHDFQFACGVYPAHDTFVSSVRQEAIDNVIRLRSHACIALFCGNNEDYQMVMQWGDVPSLPAVKIYEEVLPDVVESLTSGQGGEGIAYWRGSPYGGKGWDTADPTVGDVHQWNVWGGKEFPYQNYDILGGRFVSEFGVPAMPDMKTIEYWMGGADKKEWYAQSPLIAQHCKAGVFERRFSILLNDNLRATEDLETYAFNTRLLQAEALGYAYRVWRRQWRGKGKEYTSGVIVWQLNDCWPVTSWAIADYFLRPKPAYYVIAREMAPVTINVQRTVIHNRPSDRPRCFYEFGATQSHGASIDVWGANSTLQAVTANVEITAIDLESSWTWSETRESVLLLPNQSTEILSIPCPCPDFDQVKAALPVPKWTTSRSVVVGVRLIKPETREVIARTADWPQPYRYFDFKAMDTGLKVLVEGESVKVESRMPMKGVVLSIDDDQNGYADVKWSDNALDLMPGDPQVVIVKGLEGREIKVAYLGKEKV